MRRKKPTWGETLKPFRGPFIFAAALLIIWVLVAVNADAATLYAKAFYDSDNGDSARVVAFDALTGDSIAGSTMTEATAGEGARWSASLTIDVMRPVLLWGYIKEGTTPTFFSYTVDLAAQAVIDSLNTALDSMSLVLDSLRSQDDWAAHQTTADSLYDSLLVVLDSLENLEAWVATSAVLANVRDTVNASIDTLQNQDNWILKPTVAGRSLDVTATGAAGIDWANVENPTTTVGLSGTTVGTVTAATLAAGQPTKVADTTAAKVWDYSIRTATVTGTVTLANGQFTKIADTVLADSLSYQGAASALTEAGIADAVWDEDTTGHNTAQSYSVLIKDTSAYQGSASGLTVANIIDSLKNHPPDDTGNGSLLGQLARNIDTTISAAVNGDGQYTITFFVIDTSGTDTILTDAKITINNEAQTGTAIGPLWSRAAGRSYNLDTGSYAVLISRAGYTSITDTLAVSAAASCTVFTYNVAAAGTPVSFSMRSYSPGYYANAIIKVNLKTDGDTATIAIGDSTIAADYLWAAVDTADANGDLTMYLYSNDVLTGDSTWYQVTAYNSTQTQLLMKLTNFHVPDSSAAVRFDDLTQWR